MDPLLLNDLHVFFAQFICHDFQNEIPNRDEPSFIPVPTGDPWFDPFSVKFYFLNNLKFLLITKVIFVII